MGGDRTLVKRQYINGKLSIDGEKELLVQDIIRSFHIISTDLKAANGFSIYEGTATYRQRIRGKATIERGDSLAIASWGEKTKALNLSVIPVPEDHRSAWNMVVGHVPYDWEIGLDPLWFAEIHLPQSAFDRIMAEIQAGHVTHLFAGADLDLWAQDHDRHTPPSEAVTWFLIPDEKLANHVGVGEGKLSDINWTKEAPTAGHTKLSARPDKEPPAGSFPVTQPPNSLVAPIAALTNTINRTAAVIVIVLAVIAFRL